MGVWNSLFYTPYRPGPEETPAEMPQNAPGLPWCEETYDPAIDRGPNELSGTGLPLPPYENEERQAYRRYLEDEPIPAFSHSWQIKGPDTQAPWQKLLYQAPCYPFLKNDPVIQKLFEKLLKKAREELCEFSPKGKHTVKAGERLRAHGNEFHLLITVTGSGALPQEAAFVFSCNQ